MSSFRLTIFATDSHPGRLRGLPETKNCSVVSSENERIDTLAIYTGLFIPNQGIGMKSSKRDSLMSQRMDFRSVVATLNILLARTQPNVFNSSWIRTHAPHCYRFIQRNVRTEVGGIDWDRITHALERKFQKRWGPAKARRNPMPYEDPAEVEAIWKKYPDKRYVFIAPSDVRDRQIRDVMGISLVRLAQSGNLLARRELLGLIRYTIDDWIEQYCFLSRWRGHEEEMEKQLEGCIRRYRYSGSFLTYLFRTLECAGRGIRPAQAYSLDYRV